MGVIMKSTFYFIIQSFMILFDYEFYLFPLVLMAFLFLPRLIDELRGIFDA